MNSRIEFNFADVITKFHRVQVISMIFFDEELKFKKQLYDDACKVYGKSEVDADLNFLKSKYEDGDVLSECKPLQCSAKQVTEANTKTNSKHKNKQ